MDKQTFLRRLEEGLRQLPPEEREDILSYHREYFQEAGPEQEAKVIQELGDPALLARRLVSEYGEQPAASAPPPSQPEAPKKKRGAGILVAILAVLASPIALPLAAALAAVAVALMAVIVGVLAAGIVLVALGFSSLALYPPAALVVLGAGLFCCGLGLLGVMPAVCLIQSMFRGIASLFRKAVSRRKKA